MNLSVYLKLNSNAMVDLVNKNYVPAEITKEPAFEALAALLMEKFVHQLDGKKEIRLTMS